MDRASMEMAILVVLIAALLAAVVALVWRPAAGSQPIATALVGLIGSVIAGLLALLGRARNCGGTPHK